MDVTVTVDITLAEIVAVLAILVSIGTAIKQWNHDLRVNKINLEADYFRSLYSEHLLHKLPKARSYLRFSGGKLVDVDKLVDELNQIRQDSLYFKYSDEVFYEKLKTSLRALEDYIITCSEQNIRSQENQNEVTDQIQEKMKEIYEVLSKKYHGK